MVIKTDVQKAQKTMETKVLRGKIPRRRNTSKKKGEFSLCRGEDYNVTLPLFSLLGYRCLLAIDHVSTSRVCHTWHIYKCRILNLRIILSTMLWRFDKKFEFRDNSFVLDSFVGGLLVLLLLLLLLESFDLSSS